MNSKAYIVSKSLYYDFDSDITVGVYLDKQKCEEEVKKLNIPFKREERISEECRKCRTDKNGNDICGFRLKNTCKRSCIKEDRNGKYCENDKSNEYGIKSYAYFIHEVDLIG